MNKEYSGVSSNRIRKVVDAHQRIRSLREPRIRDFVEGRRPFLIHQELLDMSVFTCRTPEQSFQANFQYVESMLDFPSDHIPYMEPWFGTGVYANMYGCEYFWREGESPAVHYRHHALDAVRNLRRPSWENSEIAQLVLETIRYFKLRTGNALPIVWTDTQSASDTATLILDATETLAACLYEPETIMQFMQDINALVIEFSQVQADLIGDALIAPGHLFMSGGSIGGMSVADDNIACNSPAVNAAFNLQLDEQLGRAMGGIAIHSCGNWTATMPSIKQYVPSCIAIDCAIDKSNDPNPNPPKQVRDAFAGSGIAVQVRLTGETDVLLETMGSLLHPDLRVIVWPSSPDIATAERNYDVLNSCLSEFYKKSSNAFSHLNC